MNPYEILGVNKESDPYEIKKAYRKCAKKHHPDAGGDEEKFKVLQIAYSILSSSEKKEHFDKFGDTESVKTQTVYDKLLVIFVEEIRNSNFNCDIIGSISEKLGNNGIEIERRILSVESEIVKFKMQIGRVVSSSESNFYEDALTGRIEECKGQIEILNKNLVEVNELKQALSDYKDERPEKNMSGNFVIRSTGGNFS